MVKTRHGKYPHHITLSQQSESEAEFLMKHQNRSMSNLIENCIRKEFNKIPTGERQKVKSNGI